MSDNIVHICLECCTTDTAGLRVCHKMEEHALHEHTGFYWRLARSELGPVARHHWWKHAMGLSSSDPGVDEPLLLKL